MCDYVIVFDIYIYIYTFLGGVGCDYVIVFEVGCCSMMFYVQMDIRCPCFERRRRDITAQMNERYMHHEIMIEIHVSAYPEKVHYTQRIHVWYIYLHLVDVYGKCR